VVLGLYGLFVLWLVLAAEGGVMPVRPAFGLGALLLLGALIFLLLVRSGWSERLFPDDPSLTLLQSVFAIVCAAGAYLVAGDLRGGGVALLLLAVTWGAFKLDARQSGRLALLGFLGFGGAIAWRASVAPSVQAARVDWLLLLLTALACTALALLLRHLAGLRSRLQRQHDELNQAFERIRLLATHDELTGLPNRRAMADALQSALTRQARLSEPVALVMIDLDHFKAINDDHGHRVGDVVLRGFAERAQCTLRAIDVLGRWGGEEFLLLLPDTTLEQALACVERLREQLRSSPFDEVAEGLSVRFSAGVTACLGLADVDAAIERADRALYRAKSGGRGRTELG